MSFEFGKIGSNSNGTSNCTSKIAAKKLFKVSL